MSTNQCPSPKRRVISGSNPSHGSLKPITKLVEKVLCHNDYFGVICSFLSISEIFKITTKLSTFHYDYLTDSKQIRLIQGCFTREFGTFVTLNHDMIDIKNIYTNEMNSTNSNTNDSKSVCLQIGEKFNQLYTYDSAWYIDNGSGEITCTPICSVNKQYISTGHSNEKLIKEFKFKRLFLYGKDVKQEYYWKQRANNSFIQFYQLKENPKTIRMTVRESKIGKLRLNQIVTYPLNNSHWEIQKIDKKKNGQTLLFCKWIGFDITHAEQWENLTQWKPTSYGIYFYNDQDCQSFKAMFEQSSRANGDSDYLKNSNGQDSNSDINDIINGGI